MKLRSDLTLLPLDDEFVVFSEVAQCLFGLNASAAFVFHRLQEHHAAPELITALASEARVPVEKAGRWVTKTLAEFGSLGMLADGPGLKALPMGTLESLQSVEDARFKRVLPYAVFEPAVQRRYRLLETCMLIRFGAPEQTEAVDAAIGHLAIEDDSAPTIVMDLALNTHTGYWRSDIYLDGKPFRYVPRLSMLGPIVKASLWHAAVKAHDFLYYIHAGVVGTDKSCILLPAAPGSGKSSLTAALVHGGFQYFSDEVALIQRSTYRVPPVPLAICVKSTGWDLMERFYPKLAALRIHGREDGKLVRYLAPPSGAAQHPPAPVSHIVFPRYRKDVSTELKPIARTAALQRLMDECLGLRQRLNLENVEELLGWIAGVECYDLRFSSLDQAAALVTQLASVESAMS